MTRPQLGREPQPVPLTSLSRRAVLGWLAACSPVAKLLGVVPPDPETPAPPAPAAPQPAAPVTASPPVAPAPAAPPTRFFVWKEIAPGVVAAMSPDGSPVFGGNTTLIVGKDEAMLLDTKYPSLGAALRREAESFGRPLKRVLVTHHHADHTGGDWAFTANVPVVGHVKCKPRVLGQLPRYTEGLEGMVAAIAKLGSEQAKALAAEAEQLRLKAGELKAEQFAPTQTIDADANLEVGGVKAQVRHFGPAHTDNDLVVFLPDLNVLHTGDLLFNGFHAFLDRPGGGSCAGWIATLDKMVALCNDKTVVVPGHGELTNVDALKRQASYLATIRALVEEQVKAGKPKEEVVKLAPPAEYEKYGLVQLFAMTVGAVFDEVTESAKPAEKK